MDAITTDVYCVLMLIAIASLYLFIERFTARGKIVECVIYGLLATGAGVILSMCAANGTMFAYGTSIVESAPLSWFWTAFFILSMILTLIRVVLAVIGHAGSETGDR